MRKIQSEDLSLEVAHPDAAGIDIGNESRYVAVPPSREPTGTSLRVHHSRAAVLIPQYVSPFASTMSPPAVLLLLAILVNELSSCGSLSSVENSARGKAEYAKLQ